MFIWGSFSPTPAPQQWPEAADRFSTVCLLDTGVGKEPLSPSLCVGKGRELDTCVCFDMLLTLPDIVHLKVRCFHTIFYLHCI